MKKNVSILFIIFVIISCSHAITLKMGSLAPNGSPWDKALRTMASDWNKISNGKVQLKIFSGGIAGGEEDMIRKMRIGQLNAAGLSGVGFCRIFPGVLALHLPLLIRTDDELAYVLKKMRPTFEAEFEKKGFKVLMWTKIGWVHFFSKNTVKTPDDLQAHKFFTYAGDPDGIQAWKNAGFNPIPLQPNDLMTALQSGMVNAFSATPLTAAAYQWFGMAKNMCGMQWAPFTGGVIISMKSWKKIPEPLRKKLIESANRIGETAQKEINEADASSVETMKKHGLIVNKVDEETVKKWNKAAKQAYLSVINKSFDEASYNKIKKYVEEYRVTNGKK